jgi:transcriptional regulator of acetoin/glycerol metabolism
MAHSWPGNLRELRNELERAILRSDGDTIEGRHLMLDRRAAPPELSDLPGGTLEDVERAYIERVLREEHRVESAAQRLGIPRSTLYQKIRALGIELPR